MGLFDQMTCGCSNENTSCTADNKPAEAPKAPEPAPAQSCSCSVGVGSSSTNTCCSVGVGSSSADACSAARKAAEEQQRILNRKRVLGR